MGTYRVAAWGAAMALCAVLGAGAPVHAKEAGSSESQAKAEKCLAEAIYFEARGESARGQLVVGQVILNRVENERFPDTVCGVVYQNAHRRDACQFSFACDGKPETITDKRSWKAAELRSRRLLACDETCKEEQNWTDGVWAATHYHATYVSPRWASKLHHAGKVGTHLFYVEGA